MLGAQEVLTEGELRALSEPAAGGTDPVQRTALRERVTRRLDDKLPAGK